MNTTPKNTTPKTRIGTSGEPGHADLHEDHIERGLDEALEETFPASDPLPIRDDDHDEDHARRESQVDEALEDTFPASDPVAPAQPRKK